MKQSIATHKAWYKQFWPWFLISIPLASIIAGIAMIIISIDGADDLVKTDYYKEGLSINQQFDKELLAQNLQIKAELHYQPEKILIKISSKAPLDESLFLNFHHATIEQKDFRLALQQTASGDYFVILNNAQQQQIKGKWYLQLEPHNKIWRLQKSWYLPATQPLLLGK